LVSVVVVAHPHSWLTVNDSTYAGVYYQLVLLHWKSYTLWRYWQGIKCSRCRY